MGEGRIRVLWFLSQSPEDTRAQAARLGGACGGEGACVALIGALGAGKTAFVQGLASGLGMDAQTVASPTFVIASEYPLPGGRRLAHVDLYRVRDEDELELAGFSDLEGRGTILAVEWADRLPAALPADRLEVNLERQSASTRRLEARARGAGAEALLERWRNLLLEAGVALECP